MKENRVNPTHLVCRDLQHAWKPVNARRTADGYERIMQCLRCHAQKVQRLDTYGFLLGSRMKYPPGYLSKGQGRLTQRDRARMRVSNMDRGFGHA